MNKKKMMMFEIMSASLGGGGADVSGVTATAPDVDEGKIFVDSTGTEVEGTSTYKADYIALNTLVGETTATAEDVDSGKKFMLANGTQGTGSSTYKADYITLNNNINTLNNTFEPVLLGDGSDTNVYANVSNVTATASDVAQGKIFVNSTGQEVAGTASGSSADDSNKIIERTTFYSTNTLPTGITKIGDYAFYKYSFLRNMTLPDTVTQIGDYAFYDCDSMSLINFGNSITKIGNYAFSGCVDFGYRTIISFPSTLTTIGNYAFSDSGLTNVVFLGTPTTISSTAFSGCFDLTSIKVPWSEGAVANAPWGASSASIQYDYTPS